MKAHKCGELDFRKQGGSDGLGVGLTDKILNTQLNFHFRRRAISFRIAMLQVCTEYTGKYP